VSVVFVGVRMMRVRGCKNIVRLWFMKLSDMMLAVESGEGVKRSYFYMNE
jgi:hypothetical protein